MCLPKSKGRSSSAQPMATSTKSLLEKYFYPENLKVQNEIQFEFSWLKEKNWLMCRFILSVLMVNSGESQWLIRTNENVRFVYVCVRNISNRDYLSLCGKEANECSYSVLTNSFVTDSNPEFDSVFDSRQYFSYWIEPFFFCQIQNFSFSSIKTKANRTFDDFKDHSIGLKSIQGVMHSSLDFNLQYRSWLSAKSHSKDIFHCQIVILCKIKKWVNCISFRT